MRSEPATDSVAVIVVNWNTWRLCVACLESLRASSGASWHLYLVDNASSDDSAEHLSDLGDDVTFIQSPINGGWTGGNNLGLRRAVADGHERFFVLNSDARVERDTLAVLSDFSRRNPDAVVGPLQIEPDGRHYNFIGTSIRPFDGIPTSPLFISADSKEVAELPEYFDTAYIRGSGMLFTREQLDAVGYFDDAFYLNYDDTDWSFRARAAGFRTLMMKNALLIHETSASIGGAQSPLNIYFMIRNSLLFSERHGNLKQRLGKLKATWDEGADLTWRDTFFRRTRTMMFGADAKQVAFRRGVRDYVLRRFGDCPRSIRELQARSKQRYA